MKDPQLPINENLFLNLDSFFKHTGVFKTRKKITKFFLGVGMSHLICYRQQYENVTTVIL